MSEERELLRHNSIVELINNTDDINKLLGSLLLFSESNARK